MNNVYGLGVLSIEVQKYQIRQVEGYVRVKLSWNQNEIEKNCMSKAVKLVQDGSNYVATEIKDAALQISPLDLRSEAMNSTLNTNLQIIIEQAVDDTFTSARELGRARFPLARFLCVKNDKLQKFAINKESLIFLKIVPNDDLTDFLFGSHWLSIENASVPEIPKSWWSDDSPKELELEIQGSQLPFGLTLAPVKLKSWQVLLKKTTENGEEAQIQQQEETKWSVDWTTKIFCFIPKHAVKRLSHKDATKVTVLIRRTDTRWPVSSFDIRLDTLFEKHNIEIWNNTRTVRLVLATNKPFNHYQHDNSQQNDFDDFILMEKQATTTNDNENQIEQTQDTENDISIQLQEENSSDKAKLEVKKEIDNIVWSLAREMSKISLSKQTGNRIFPKIDQVDERRWLFALNKSGLYHELKEGLKPKIQALIQNYTDTFQQNNSWQSKERFLSELYGELSACANAVLNTRFRIAQTQLLEATNTEDVLVQNEAASPSINQTIVFSDLERRLECCERRLADEEAIGVRFVNITKQHDACLNAVLLGSNINIDTTQLDAEDIERLSQLRAVVWRRIAQSILCLAGRRCFPHECTSRLALTPLKQALTLDPNHGPSLVLLTAVLLENGEDDATATISRRGIEMCATGLSRDFVVLSHVVDGIRLSLSEEHDIEARLALVAAVESLSLFAKNKNNTTEFQRLDAIAAARERVRVLLDAADWAASNGLKRCADRAVSLAGLAEARAQYHGTILSSEQNFRLTPKALRSQALCTRATVALLHGQTAAAEHDALKLTVLAPDTANTWLLLGAIYDENINTMNACDNNTEISSRQTKAANALARALAILQTDPVEPPPLWLYCRVANLCLELGDCTTASNVYIDACRRYRTSVTAWRGAGSLFLRLGQPLDAEFALEEANAIDKHDATIWALLALCNLRLYRDHGQDPVRIERAISVLEQALSLHLDHSDILCQLGLSFAELDRRALAIDLLSRANDLAHSHNEALRARLALARTHAAQNSLEDAARSFASVLALDPPSSLGIQTELDDILRRLGKHTLPE